MTAYYLGASPAIGTESVSGGFDTTIAFNRYAIGTSVLSGAIRVAAKVSNKQVQIVSEVFGSLIRLSTPAEGAEATYELTGKRTSVPILIYALDVVSPADVASVPSGGSFLVSASYIGSPGQSMYEAGAAPNSIGTKIQPTIGLPYLVFRPPVNEEVVWEVTLDQLYRFHFDRNLSQYIWQRYISWPERAVAGQYVFDIFDPDGIYKYFARILGAAMSEWSYDTRILLNFYDPDEVSHFFLAGLAANYGLELDSSDPLTVKRAKTKSAVGTFKFKGLDKAVRLRIRSLGYSGYVNEIWVNPDNVTNYRSTALNAFGSFSSLNNGANSPGTTKEYPHGYRTDDGTVDNFFPSSRLSLHLNDGSGNPLAITTDIKNAVANDLLNDVLPAHVDIRWFVTDIPIVTEGITVSDTLVITHV